MVSKPLPPPLTRDHQQRGLPRCIHLLLDLQDVWSSSLHFLHPSVITSVKALPDAFIYCLIHRVSRLQVSISLPIRGHQRQCPPRCIHLLLDPQGFSSSTLYSLHPSLITSVKALPESYCINLLLDLQESSSSSLYSIHLSLITSVKVLPVSHCIKLLLDQ